MKNLLALNNLSSKMVKALLAIIAQPKYKPVAQKKYGKIASQPYQ